MAQQIVNLGAYEDDPTADDIREGGDKINDNFSELYGFANNILLKQSVSRLFSDSLVSEIVTKVNASFGFEVQEIHSPVLLTGLKGYNMSVGGGNVFVPTHKVTAYFGAGKGLWGDGGTAITAAMLTLNPLENVTPEDIENDPDSPVIELGPVADIAGFITAANAEERDFTDTTKSYYLATVLAACFILLCFRVRLAHMAVPPVTILKLPTFLLPPVAK